LNGDWAFAFDDEDVGLARRWHAQVAREIESPNAPLNRRIIIPFCHQAELSGIGDPSVHDVVWYARTFDTGDWNADADSMLLHFGAVDYWASVWVNGVEVAKHEGGHTPFTADITAALVEGENNVVVVRAEDQAMNPAIPRGKQAFTPEPAHIFYTRTTGIWQTVWLEPASPTRLEYIRLTPSVDSESLGIQEQIVGFRPGLALEVEIRFRGEMMLDCRVPVPSALSGQEFCLVDDHNRDLHFWSPAEPNLYDVRLSLRAQDGRILDTVESYFGMRKIEQRDGKVYLNRELLFQRLILDQGYFPGGFLTAPTDDALREDIELAKAMGFNGARKHQKVEDPRWLYWADRLGFLVWGEMANAYEYSEEYKRRIAGEWTAVIERDYNHPCVIAWVPINESAGGRATEAGPIQVEHVGAMYELTRELDSTRLIVSNDGWESVGGDLCTIHDYGLAAELERRFHSLGAALAGGHSSRPVYAPGFGYDGQPIVVSEFGGLAIADKDQDQWGYVVVRDEGELLEQYDALVSALVQSPLVAGFCYTQLTDVEQEVTGLATEDRTPKADLAKIRAITTQARRISDDPSRTLT
jgi:beta-galactosidase/beta-glucuronidase